MGIASLVQQTLASNISKKFTQKNSKALEQSNQSHPPSSVQVTSQPHWEVARAHL
jgi:hypothetical protein